MMKLIFQKEQLERLGVLPGLGLLSAEVDWALDGEGLAVDLRDTKEERLTLSPDGDHAVLTFDHSRKNLFFRGVSLLMQGKPCEENTYFTCVGSLLDLCQGNMALNLPTMKTLLRRHALMGMNCCMLYMEDTFDVPGYEYFGWMRGRYSHDELKELDDYADALGIELVPAIQTLSHQSTVVHWDQFEPMRENRRTLLPGAEETYQFLRAAMAAASAPFRSKRIHLGMDECDFLGKGGYYLQHGDVPFEDIVLAHLKRVCDIAAELKLIPLFWDDNRYAKMDVGTFPANLQRVFGSYSPHDEAWYEKKLDKHRSDRGDLLFSPEVWTNLSFAPNWALTKENLRCLPACRKKNVRQVIETVWEIGQDVDFRVNYYGLQMFAEACYGREADLAERFRVCCGGDAEGLLLLHEFDNVPSVPENNLLGHPSAASEFLLFQDPMAGMFDFDIDGLPMQAHFEALSEKLKPHLDAARGTEWESVFRYYVALADALALKSELGLNITKAYKAGDKATLQALADTTIPETARRVKALRSLARENWFVLGKPLGWEVYDIRYAGVMGRLDSAVVAIRDYLEGRRERLEELEEPRRSYFRGGFGYAGRIPAWTDKWGRLVSASSITQEYWLKLPKGSATEKV